MGQTTRPFQCALCEHWCEKGIRYTTESGRILFRCEDCKHATTMVHAPEEEE